MGEVVDFGGPTSLDIPPDKVLAGAQGQNLSMVMVIGECADGELYYASSTSDLAALILALEMCKHELLKQALG